MAPAKRKRSISPVKKEHKSITQAFLDHLSMDEAKAWQIEIINISPCVKLVNHRHISSNLTVDQLKSATSVGPFTGENFFLHVETLNIFVY